MVVGRSEWWTEEEIVASNKIQHKQQDTTAGQDVSSSEKSFIFLNNE